MPVSSVQRPGSVAHHVMEISLRCAVDGRDGRSGAWKQRSGQPLGTLFWTRHDHNARSGDPHRRSARPLAWIFVKRGENLCTLRC